MRPTWQELDSEIHDIGVKKVALELGISSSLVYKWCQEPKSDTNPEASGTSNPLDRIFTIIELSGRHNLIAYIARRFGGFYIPNPLVKGARNASFVSETMAILDKFADLMRFAEQSLTNDGKIDAKESIRLRRDWDVLKSNLESFILSCEHGHFDIAQEPS